MNGNFIDKLSINLNIVLKRYNFFLLIVILLFNGLIGLKANENYMSESNNMNTDLLCVTTDNKNLRNINIYISEPVYHITYSEECLLNINIAGLDPPQIIRGYEIQINYDTNYLTASSGDIYQGDFLNYFANSSGTTFLISGQNGAWIVTGAVLGIPKNIEKDKPTSGTLFSIKLTALSKPSCYNSVSVTLSDIVLRDELNNPILVDSVSGAEIFIQPTLIIPLQTGWNLISSWVIPPDASIEEIFKELRESGSLVKVQDENGLAYEHGFSDFWLNEIGNFQLTEGYYVEVNTDCSLKIKGDSIILPMEIQLQAGWNIVPFLYSVPINAIDFLQSNMDMSLLQKVQDENGNAIEPLYGNNWLNDIGDFKEGEAYYIQVSHDAILSFPVFRKK